VLGEVYPGPCQNFAIVEPRPVDYWLAEQPGDGAVAQFPFYQVEDQDQVYNTLIHGKPFIGGFFNAFPPKQYLEIRPVMEGFPDEESISLLKELGIHFIIVDTGEYDDVPRVLTALKGSQLEQIAQFGEEIVFILPKTP
jgi:hypothetical protein